MATALDSDIDRFIRDQKAKLANERHILKKDDNYFATDAPRRQWNREEARAAKLAEQIQEERTRTPDGGLPLTNTESIKKRQELALQRKQEYKDFIEKTSQNGRKRLNRPLTPADDMGLPVGQYQKNRRELSLQRQKEYQEYMQQKQKSQDNSLRTAKDGQLSDYQLMSKQLSQQKRQEYNQESNPKKPHLEKDFDNPSIIPFNRAEEDAAKRHQMEKERQHEYQQIKAKTSHGHHEDILEKLEEQYQHLRNDAEKNYLKAALENVKQEYEAKWAAQRAQQQQNKSIVDSHTASTKLENGAQGDDYKALWSRVHSEAGVHTPRDNSFGKTGAKFDTDASVRHAMSRLEEVEYRQIWQQMHPQYKNKGHMLDEPANKPETYTGIYDGQKQRHQEERKQELKGFLAKKMEELKENDKRRQWEPVKGKAIPDSSDEAEAVRKKLADERKKEYEEIIKSKSEGNRTWREPSQEKLLPLGSYEQRRKEYGNERNREYNEYLKSTGGGHTNLVKQTDEYKATFPGMNESDAAKIQKVRERNAEYNEFLNQKQDREGRSRYGDQKPSLPSQEEGVYATLPGLNYSSSASKRRVQERNQEYNEFLRNKGAGARHVSHGDDDIGRPPPAPRKGWTTPTYEEMLDKKRQQESQYRRLNDPGFSQLPFRSYGSEGALNTLEPQKDSRSNDQSAGYFATLPIGQRDRDSAKQRQKEQYREELQRQMRETQEARRREKQNNLLVNETGLFKPEERKTPTVKVSATPYDPRQGPNKGLEPYHSKILEGLDKLDQLSPRTEVILGRRRFEELDKEQRLGGLSRAGASSSLGTLNLNRSSVTRGGAGTGLLDTRFDSLLEAPRISTLAPPPGLEYQPASYVTQGGGIGLHSSVDEAYNFFAVRDPLNPNSFSGNGGNTGRGGDFSSAANQELSFAGRGGGGEVRGGAGGARNTRVHFEDDRSQGRGKPQTAMDFPTDDDKKRQARQNASSYQEELNRQIEEKKRKKQLEKEEQERYEMKLEREAQEYNPYGRGGGGAPNRDMYGNLITDLRQMKRINEQGGGGGGGGGGSGGGGAPPAPSTYRSPRNPPASVRDDLFGPPPIQMTAEGEQSFARGGHGIFGLPKTDAEKITADRYKDDLKRQIEQKKLEDMQKKEEERREEEREQRRVEEQQRRMQLEYEEEHRKLREKEEEARRKNEELVRQAEERKREAERRRREEDEKRQAELRREREAEINARLAEIRSSPPVPAARTRTAEPEARPRSASRQDYGPPIRSQSADVLNQLAAMRQQLQNERKRVETMLQNERNEPDVFDPRLVQRPPPAPVVRPEIDVFETARNRNAVAVRRTPADRPNPQAVEDFNALKHKDDTDSRTAFRSMFPENPVSSDMLEAQQLALLREQEQHLRNLREQRQFESGYPKTVPLSPRLDSHTPQQLLSNSAFVDVDGMTYFPDDFEDIPNSQRNESARARRRRRIPSSPRLNSEGRIDPFGSTSSLNVDRLAKKNEDRLKRLRELQGDDLSLYDADDVLDRFMSKQAHNRPPSRQTLQDDTWMFAGAGSKASGY